MNEPKAVYRPDSVPSPGKTLLSLLSDLGMTQKELALRCGRPLKTINEITRGRTQITPETALQFESVLGVPASFWLNRERRYREHLERRGEIQRLEGGAAWVQRFPIRKMKALGWIDPAASGPEQVRELLRFFGVASPTQYDRWVRVESAMFRTSHAFAIDRHALAAWLRQGVLDAQAIHCRDYEESAFRTVLREARTRTMEPPEEFVPWLTRSCAEAGVAFVLVRELPRIRTFGVTRWLTPRKAILQLCLRNRFADIFWFTFFHESAHILLHRKKDVFLEEDDADSNRLEAEADEFASEFLIPKQDLDTFVKTSQITHSTIKRFAAHLRIAPGIVVGRLQHEKYIEYSEFNDLRARYSWQTNESS